MNAAPRMTPRRMRVVDRLLDELLDLDGAARASRLASLDRRHPRIGALVRRLLEASDSPLEIGTVFGRIGAAALSGTGSPDARELEPGERVGDWRVIESVGTGGMGRVYRGERADGAFEMPVAIKLIRALDDDRMAQRFELERRLLARLDHPNIARIIDGGALADGRGYLVMEWVEGRDLSDCRDELSRDWRRAVRVLREIAEAVAHAHQRQVVHGDIKPPNVRLTPEGRVRLLDFGVARLVDDAETKEHDAGMLALTPAFSAPEQRAGRPAETTSDVHALGAMLGWLLTGRPARAERPVPATDLPGPRRRAIAAVLRKATAAEPGERYASVPGLISDLDALLTDRPVGARRSGPLARIRLWSRRHRVGAALAGLGLVGAAAGIAVLAWQAQVVRAERDLARFEAQRSTTLREQMILLFREAGRNAESADVSARELLARTTEAADRLYADDPVTRAAVRAMLGEIYIAMDDFAAAEPLLEGYADSGEAIGSELLRALILADLAQVRVRQGRSEEAESLTSRSLALLRERAGTSTVHVADVLQIRGQALRGLGRWPEAIETLERGWGLARRTAFPSTVRARSANNLATTLIYAGQPDRAMPYLREALANWRELGGEDSSSALTIMANLAGLLHQRGELDAAESLYREAIDRRTRRFGASGALAAAHLNLGALLALTGPAEEALDHAETGLEMILRYEGTDSLGHARALLSRGRVLRDLGQRERASADLGAARDMFSDRLGPEHLFTRIAEMHEASLSPADEAEPRFAALAETLDAMQPASGRYLASALCELARLRLELGRNGEAREPASRCLALREESLGKESWETLEAAALLALASGHDTGIIATWRDVAGTKLRAGHPRVRWWNGRSP